MQQMLTTFDLNKIRQEVDMLMAAHKLTNGTQLLLQSVDGLEWYNITAPYKIREDLRETDYIIPNTPDGWEITRFMRDHSLCRTRIMLLPFRKCYSWHRDVGHRLHLAVHTNDSCFFVENGALVNIPADGHPYLLDVNDYHTAMNCSESEFDRIHIVGVVR